MPPDPQAIAAFRETVWDYYARHGRDMPWRRRPEPYRVLVSELMLQQTQVGRVEPKFTEFVRLFPDPAALARAPLPDVLRAWNGLGYNRRAKYLWLAAQKIISDFGGRVPDTPEELASLPGVGRNTAGAILAYAYNSPVVFIETNIRTVFFHHFFADDAKVADAEIEPLVRAALDPEHPREWYWALMDYGAHLKRTAGAGLHKSCHYVKQSAFEGSRRQLRGRILRELLPGPLPRGELLARCNDERAPAVLQTLAQEGLVEVSGTTCALAGHAP